MIDTLVYMVEQLIPEDNPQDDTDHHKNIRRLSEKPINTLTIGTLARTKSDRLLKVSILGTHQGQTESQVTI